MLASAESTFPRAMVRRKIAYGWPCEADAPPLLGQRGECSDALPTPYNEPDREAREPGLRPRFRALADHAADSPGVDAANVSDPAVPLPDLPLRGSEL
jgi:hypothetical protein